MPAEVIVAIEKLAMSQEAEPGLAFANRVNRILFHEFKDDEDDEYSYNKSLDKELAYDNDIDDDEVGGGQLNEAVEDTVINDVEEALKDMMTRGTGRTRHSLKKR